MVLYGKDCQQFGRELDRGNILKVCKDLGMDKMAAEQAACHAPTPRARPEKQLNMRTSTLN